MLDRDRILESFRRALDRLEGDWDGASSARRITPRSVAVRAHAIFCTDLVPGEKRPSLTTFCMFVAGKSALPEVVDLLETASIRPATHARLDRKRLHAVFHEAVRRLEARILRGQAKPLQIARRAYEIYTRDAHHGPQKPSRHTFQRLIYGKNADPEILTLIETALTKPKKD